MNIAEAKEIRMVDFLQLLGHSPVRICNSQYWYLSPLRQEDTPSFKVNDRLNEWYDFGEATGGDLVELGEAPVPDGQRERGAGPYRTAGRNR